MVDNRNGITYVLGRAKWYWELSKLLLDSNRASDASAALRDQLAEHVVELYKKILLYEIKSTCFYYHNKFTAFLKDVFQGGQWAAMISDIRACEDDIRKDSSQYNTEEFKSLLEALGSTAATQEERLRGIMKTISNQTEQQKMAVETAEDKQCLIDLCVTNTDSDKTRIEDAKGGLLWDSCRWILDNERFIRWRDDPDQRLLWINGSPGKGKTMLLCGIINELAARPFGPLCFFFCQATDPRINSATAVLRGLIHHIVRQERSLLKHVRTRYDSEGKSLFDNTNAWVSMRDILANILEDHIMKDAVIVVDALDECVTGLEELLQFISGATSSYHSKWIVSSRRHENIKEVLDEDPARGVSSLALDSISMSSAIGAYIQRKVNDLAGTKRYDAQTKADVEKYLIANADGTFLWVSLVCQKLKSLRMLKKPDSSTLESFPAGLTPLYEKMLESIDAGDAYICNQLLAIATIAYRPLSPDEIAAFIGPQEERVEDIVEYCGSFLILQERENTVYFIHQSAKDFLQERAVHQIFPTGIESMHYTAFCKSLEGLSGVLKRDVYALGKPGFPSSDVSTPQPDPLAAMRYSCVYWVDHLCDALSVPSRDSDTLQDDGPIHTFLKEKYLYWLEALSLIRSISKGVSAVRKLESQVGIYFFFGFFPTDDFARGYYFTNTDEYNRKTN